MESRVIDTDILVIGASSGGMWAAIRARDFGPRVTVVDKGIVASAGISSFIHVVTSPLPREDLIPAIKEIAERSTFLVDQTRTEITLAEMGDRFDEMDRWGVPFQRDSSGKIITVKRMGQKVTSCAFINGRPMMQTLREQALKKGVQLVERVMITDLLTSDGQLPTKGRVIGAVGFNTVTGDFYTFRAKAVIMASGIISGKLHLGYADGVTGDGQAMAWRAGAELENMEMTTNPVFPLWERKFCTGGQGEFMSTGARLVNKPGEELISKYAPNKEAPFLTRTQLCQAAAKEIIDGKGPVYFDMRHLTDKDIEMMRQVLPSAMKAFDEEGINLQKQRVEITPIVPYMCGGGEGGIKITPMCQSNIPGLYAVAAASHCAGNHSYIIGIAQSYGFVTGYRAGEDAARLVSRDGQGEINKAQVEALKEAAFAPLQRKKGPNPEQVYLTLNKVMVPYKYSFVKHADRINTTLSEIKRVKKEELPRIMAKDIHELVKANEVRSYADLTAIIYRGALERKESRIGHYREEYPYRDDIEWLKWIIARRDGEDSSLRFEPLDIDRYPAKPARRERIAPPVKFTQ